MAELTKKYLLYDVDDDKYYWEYHLDRGWGKDINDALAFTSVERALQFLADEVENDEDTKYFQIVEVYTKV